MTDKVISLPPSEVLQHIPEHLQELAGTDGLDHPDKGPNEVVACCRMSAVSLRYVVVIRQLQPSC